MPNELSLDLLPPDTLPPAALSPAFRPPHTPGALCHRPLRALFFDLDDTLYPLSSGIRDAVRRNIETYMMRHLGVRPENASREREELYRTYGLTLTGLQARYGVDSEHYWAFVHGTLDYPKYLHRDDRLRHQLESIPVKKYVLTNADDTHARRAIEVLGLDGVFEKIIDVKAMGMSNKPHREAFEAAMKIAGVPWEERGSVVLFDDSEANVKAARKFGWMAVKVDETVSEPGSEGERKLEDEYEECCIETIGSVHELQRRAPWLWHTTTSSNEFGERN